LIRKGGKGWSVNRIVEALETSPSMVYRTRKQRGGVEPQAARDASYFSDFDGN
jgi:hypothetical protein